MHDKLSCLLFLLMSLGKTALLPLVPNFTCNKKQTLLSARVTRCSDQWHKTLTSGHEILPWDHSQEDEGSQGPCLWQASVHLPIPREQQDFSKMLLLTHFLQPSSTPVLSHTAPPNIKRITRGYRQSCYPYQVIFPSSSSMKRFPAWSKSSFQGLPYLIKTDP